MNQFILKLRILLLQNKLYYLLFIIGTIISFVFTNNYNYKSIYHLEDAIFKLKIISYKIDGNKLSMELDGKENLIGNYYFETEKEKNTFANIYSIGDELIIKGKLESPKNNTIPNTFNYKKYLQNKKIQYIVNIESIKMYKKNKNIFYKIKNYVYKRISNIDNNEYIYALVLGECLYIDSETYRINGVSHLFSLSGLHVSLIASMILVIVKAIKRKKYEENMKDYLFIFVFLLFFAFITNFKVSFLRAIIFFILSGINKVYYYNVKGDNLLIIVYIVMLMINPFCIYDVSFQLSWVITYFLFFTTDLCKSNNYIIKLLWASFISLLSSLPIIINNFYTVNLLSIINNLFFVPFVSYIIYPLSLLTTIFNFLNKILLFLTNILEKVSLILSNIKIFNINFPKMSCFEIIIYYILFVLIIKCRKKIKYIIMITLLLIYSLFKININKNTKLYFFDVGQGDSAFIITPNKKTIMIDTGGYLKYEIDEWKKKNKEFSLMNNSIIPFFKSIGVNKIDYLFLTHGDDDHAGYAKDLTQSIHVENIIINNGKVNNLEKELKYHKVKSNYKIDNIVIRSLNDKDYNDENKNSLILLFEVENKKILFMGDASIEQEKNIIRKYNLENIYILKAGHHGSRTSSCEIFVESINPRYSIISVGKNNKFGHPDKNVFNVLSQNSEVFRTDEDGTIYFEFDKKDVNIIKYLPY